MNIQDAVIENIREHAKAEYPRECCGVVQIIKGKQRYTPCRNLAATPSEHFVLSPEDYAAAEDRGSVVAIVHSHPDQSPQPSQADRVMCEKTRLPWLIMNWPVGHYEVLEPSGYQVGYEGREFSHGILDCFSIIRDWYANELDIDIDDYERADDWWLNGENHYMDRYKHAGFELVDDELKAHDVILMKIAAPVPNHGAIYVGDSRILHHLHGRISSKDIYGGWYREVTTGVLRHRSLL